MQQWGNRLFHWRMEKFRVEEVTLLSDKNGNNFPATLNDCMQLITSCNLVVTTRLFIYPPREYKWNRFCKHTGKNRSRENKSLPNVQYFKNSPTASMNPSFSMISRRTPLTDSSESTSIWRTNRVLFRRFKTLESAKYSLLAKDGIVTSTLNLPRGSSARWRANERFILCE